MGVHRPRRRHCPRRSAVVRRLWQAPTLAFVRVVVIVVVIDPPPPRDAHREDEGRPPLEGKTATTPSALSNESVELTTRCSTKTLMRLAQTGAIAKVARRTALRNLMASRDNSHSDPAGSEPQST